MATMRQSLVSIYKETKNVLAQVRLPRRERPIADHASLVGFVDRRAKFIAQTTLFGYLKTRAGTRWVLWFEDDNFVASINIAKWEIYLQCLADLAVYATSVVGRRTDATPEELSALAHHIVHTALESEDVAAERPQGFDSTRLEFGARLAAIEWSAIVEGEGPFQGSQQALVEHAPVADELKMLDTEIVINSMRFKWKNIRDDFRQLLRADAVLDDWRSGPTGAAGTDAVSTTTGRQ